jgi:hypothetical protein
VKLWCEQCAGWGWNWASYWPWARKRVCERCKGTGEKPDESEEGGTCFLCHQPIPFNTVAPVKLSEEGER